jgi:hypothetical protein
MSTPSSSFGRSPCAPAIVVTPTLETPEPLYQSAYERHPCASPLVDPILTNI